MVRGFRWVVLMTLIGNLVRAQLVPQGDDVQVNSFVTGFQKRAVVASDPATGTFVVVWHSYGGDYPQDGSGSGIFAQRFYSDGSPAGAEFQVNSHTVEAQSSPAVRFDPNGDTFVIAWQGPSEEDSNRGILARRFHADGTPATNEFHVNSSFAPLQRNPVLDMSNSGAFLIAWDSTQDGGGFGIFAQHFDSAGFPVGSEFQVNSHTLFAQYKPELAAVPSTGGFVVVWESRLQDGSDTGIFAQRFNSSGTADGSEFQVNSYTDASQQHPAIGVDPATGSFMIAWTDPRSDYPGIWARRYGSDGSPMGDAFHLASGGLPAIAIDRRSRDGVVAWTNRGGIFAQRLLPDGLPVGDELRVDQKGGFYAPAIASRGNGQFAVVFTSGSDGCIIGGHGIFGRFFASDGSSVGGEFQVNGHTPGDQLYPAVSVDPDHGVFVVVWEGSGISARRFTSDGVLLEDGLPVNPSVAFFNADPSISVAAVPNRGDFVVAWPESFRDGSYKGVFAKRFGADGVATEAFQVNSNSDRSQQAPDVAAGMDSFVVVWESERQDRGGYGVFAQRFDSSGVPMDRELQVNSYTTYAQRNPSVALDSSSGDFVVVWQSFSQDGSNYGIFGQRFSSGGSPAGREFQVNSFTSLHQRSAVVGTGNGNFIVAWESLFQDGNGFGIFAQRFTSDGTLLGSELQVNSYTATDQRFPVIGVGGDGRFVIAWQSAGQDGHSYGVFARRFTSTGLATGTEFQANSYTFHSQRHPAVGMDPINGTFLVVWQSETQDGCSSVSGTSVHLRRLRTLAPSASCPPHPAEGCIAAANGRFVAKDGQSNEDDQLVWKFVSAANLAAGDFGDPLGTNEYALCIYDDGTKKIDLTVPPGSSWRALRSGGFRYRDYLGTADGTTKIELIPGEIGQSMLEWRGKGAGLRIPASASVNSLFSGSVAVTVQLHGNGNCWETTFAPARSRHRPNGYRGKL